MIAARKLTSQRPHGAQSVRHSASQFRHHHIATARGGWRSGRCELVHRCICRVTAAMVSLDLTFAAVD